MHSEGLTEETVLRPPGRTVIGTRFVFKWKASANGEIKLANAWLSRKAFARLATLPTPKFLLPTPGVTSTRMLLTDVATADWDLLHVDDVKHAQRL